MNMMAHRTGLQANIVMRPPLQKKIRERQLPSVSVAGCWQDWESHC